jgi:hypothetical protein
MLLLATAAVLRAACAVTAAQRQLLLGACHALRCCLTCCAIIVELLLGFTVVFIRRCFFISRLVCLMIATVCRALPYFAVICRALPFSAVHALPGCIIPPVMRGVMSGLIGKMAVICGRRMV